MISVISVNEILLIEVSLKNLSRVFQAKNFQWNWNRLGALLERAIKGYIYQGSVETDRIWSNRIDMFLPIRFIKFVIWSDQVFRRCQLTFVFFYHEYQRIIDCDTKMIWINSLFWCFYWKWWNFILESQPLMRNLKMQYSF
jgi:hypothetical protein